MDDWLKYTVSAFGGAVVSGLPLGLWSLSQYYKIQQEYKGKDLELEARARRDEYEIEKVHRSDAYKELQGIINDLKKESNERDVKISEQAKQIVMLQNEHLDCSKKSAMQDVELYKQSVIIQFLETRMKNLEATVLPTSIDKAVVDKAVTEKLVDKAVAEKLAKE